MFRVKSSETWVAVKNFVVSIQINPETIPQNEDRAFCRQPKLVAEAHELILAQRTEGLRVRWCDRWHDKPKEKKTKNVGNESLVRQKTSITTKEED